MNIIEGPHLQRVKLKVLATIKAIQTHHHAIGARVLEEKTVAARSAKTEETASTVAGGMMATGTDRDQDLWMMEGPGMQTIPGIRSQFSRRARYVPSKPRDPPHHQDLKIAAVGMKIGVMREEVHRLR